ncbi:MAG: response regulator transcription factor [Oceanicoccus sp.]|uniref:response regulator transcription factor n=1 Tax=Oceanicoccus sp. TaxID=2691044 RepID=UPI0026253399|nr:response regulator transcription factor [Oceanicoccus sp.]MDG1773117.1 response regulator transcription factor [Oceanicoccus sp.]
MRVLIVDDHQLIRAALRDLLHRQYSILDCVEASSGETALSAVKQKEFDVAIVDLFIPGETAFVFLQKLCKQRPSLPVVVLSATDNQQHMQQCIDLGAKAFVNKGEAMEKVIDAIEKVIIGDVFLPSALSKKVETSISPESGELPDLNLEIVLKVLTDRQLDIIRMIAQGKSNKAIAREKELSDNTVKVHVSAILRALDLKNRTQIGLLAQKLGLINFN